MYHFSWLQLLSGPVHAIESLGLSHSEAIAVLTTWSIAFFLIAVAVVARSGLTKLQAQGGTAQFVPDAGLSIRNMVEMYTRAVHGMVAGVLGQKDASAFFWIFGALFIYIFMGNLMSVLPGGLPPTDNISNNFAMALVVLVVYVVAGVKRTGMGFFKHMMGPVAWLAPLIFMIEALGVFLIRPGSLSLRLMGNITGDHLVFGIMSDLVPVVLPSLFLALGIWVSFLQAFVFTLLSAIYVALSVGDGSDHH